MKAPEPQYREGDIQFY